MRVEAGCLLLVNTYHMPDHLLGQAPIQIETCEIESKLAQEIAPSSLIMRTVETSMHSFAEPPQTSRERRDAAMVFPVTTRSVCACNIRHLNGFRM